MIWSDLTSVIAANQSFLVSSHVGIDGDCVGSELALQWYLASAGKDVVVYNHDAVPAKLDFLSGARSIVTQRPARTFDVLVVLDCSNPDRMGWAGHDQLARLTVNIDHHRDNTHFGDINIVRENAAATAEIIHAFFAHAGVEYPAAVAEQLYAAVLTDTGGFRFANTTSSVFRMCADLAEHGADSAAIYQRAYDSRSVAALKLWSRVWSSLQLYFDDRLCIMEMPLRCIEEVGATYGDSEGMADHTIAAEGVEVGVFIKYKDAETHFSLRSRGRVDVGKIAQSIPGGGGHGCAAGCTMNLPVEEAKSRMLAILRKELG
jgi:phosphoesterase RecJ-like protein